jgi:hypothetical protein
MVEINEKALSSELRAGQKILKLFISTALDLKVKFFSQFCSQSKVGIT